MDARIAVQNHVRRWLNNPDFLVWPPAVAFNQQSEGCRREFYEKGHDRLRSMAWEMFTDPTIGAQAREEMCWIMAVGLWEKNRREKEAAERAENEPFAAWEQRARERISNRLNNRVLNMPLTSRDADCYLRLIEKARERGGHI